MNSTRTTLILLAAAAILAVSVPTIRRAYNRLFVQPEHYTFAEVERIARKADSTDAWFAVAEGGWKRITDRRRYTDSERRNGGYVPEYERLEEIWDDVVEDAPTSAHVVQYALFQSHRLGNAVEKTDAAPTALETADARIVEPAWRAIDCAAQVDPENAAVDIMRAWRHLLSDEPAQALDALDQLNEAETLTIYRDDVARAAWALHSAADMPPDVPLDPPEMGRQVWQAMVWQTVEELARVSEAARASGDDESAVAAWDSVSQIVGLILDHARDFNDIQLAQAILEKIDFPRGYLGARGARVTIRLWDAELARSADLLQAIEDIPDDQFPPPIGPGGLIGALMAMTLSWLIPVGVVLGGVLLVRRVRGLGTPPRAASWSRWLTLLAVAVGPSFVFGAFVDFVVETRFVDSSMRIGIAVPVIAVGLWLLIALVRAHRDAGEQAGAAADGGWWVAWLGHLRAVYWPTLATVVLLAVILMIPVQRGTERYTAAETQVALVGEIEYYGLDASGPVLNAEQ